MLLGFEPTTKVCESWKIDQGTYDHFQLYLEKSVAPWNDIYLDENFFRFRIKIKGEFLEKWIVAELERLVVDHLTIFHLKKKLIKLGCVDS